MMADYDNELKIMQLNCNKSKVTNVEIFKKMCKVTSAIFLLQEPYMWNNKMPGLPTGYKVLGLPKSRATVVAPVFMNPVLKEEVSSLDFTVVLIKQGTKELYLVSIYLDGKKNVISEHFIKILDFC